MKIIAFLSIFLSGLISPWILQAEDGLLSVAVLPFESNVQKPSKTFKKFITNSVGDSAKRQDAYISLGNKIAEILTADLSSNPALELVERAKLDKAFEELALGKTGLIDEQTATRIGHMVGAKVLVTGKAFPLDEELFIVAKVIGVETSRVFAAKTNGSLSGKLAPMIQELSKNISKILLKHDTALVGKEIEKKDYAELIKKVVGESKKPKVAVFVNEKHANQQSFDPAIETELIYLLTKAGFQVIDQKNKPLSDWAEAYLEDTSSSPPKRGNADVVIVGEGFSEYAARRGELISCKARVELRAIDVKTGNVLAIERKTETAVDIAQHIAAKTALQKATQEISIPLTKDMMKAWDK